MNITMIDHRTFLETISEAKTLSMLEGPGAGRTYICEREGADILIIADSISGDAIVIHSCIEDDEAGGSIHEHARASIV